MRIRITAKFASYFLASFFRTFVSCSLSHLLTNTREQSVLRWKSELDRVPSLYEKKTSRQTFGYFTRKPEIYYVLRRPRLSICRASSALLPSSSPLPKLRYPRAILYSAEFFEARRRDHREIGNSGRRRVKKASTRKEAKEERKVTSVGGRGAFVAEWKRVERGETALFHSQEWKTFFLPLPPIRSMIFASRRTFLPLQPRRK